MAKEKLNITASVLRAENKYLTMVIAIVVSVLVATLGLIGNFQIDATNTNTEEVKLLRGDITKMTISTNLQISQINNRMDVNRERASSAYKILQRNVEVNTEEIKNLKKKAYKNGHK